MEYCKWLALLIWSQFLLERIFSWAISLVSMAASLFQWLPERCMLPFPKPFLFMYSNQTVWRARSLYSQSFLIFRRRNKNKSVLRACLSISVGDYLVRSLSASLFSLSVAPDITSFPTRVYHVFFSPHAPSLFRIYNNIQFEFNRLNHMQRVSMWTAWCWCYADGERVRALFAVGLL